MRSSETPRPKKWCGAVPGTGTGTSSGATAADAIASTLAAGARTVDRLLDAAGLAPPPLTLPGEVLRDLRALFGDTVDPSAVVIRRGHVPGIPHPRAFALPGLIYLGRDPGIVMTAVDVPVDEAATDEAATDEAAGGADAGPGADQRSPRATPTLVHELVHLWQGCVIGPRYVLLALVEQVRLGRRAYDWRTALGRVVEASGAPALADLSSDLGPGGLGFEAHAQLVSEAYARRVGLAGTRAHRGRDEEQRVMDAALTRLRAGDGPSGTGARV